VADGVPAQSTERNPDKWSKNVTEGRIAEGAPKKITPSSGKIQTAIPKHGFLGARDFTASQHYVVRIIVPQKISRNVAKFGKIFSPIL